MGAATLLFFYAGGAVATGCLLAGYVTSEGAWGEDGYRIRAAFGVLAGALLWPALIMGALVSEIRRRRGRS